MHMILTELEKTDCFCLYEKINKIIFISISREILPIDICSNFDYYSQLG